MAAQPVPLAGSLTLPAKAVGSPYRASHELEITRTEGEL